MTKKAVSYFQVMWLAVFFGWLVEAFFLTHILWFSFYPQFLSVISFLAMVTLPFSQRFWVVLVVGLLKDIFGNYPFGLNTLIFFLWMILANWLMRQLRWDNPRIRLGILVFIIMLHTILFSLLLAVVFNFTFYFWLWLTRALFEIVFDLAALWLMVMLLRRMKPEMF